MSEPMKESAEESWIVFLNRFDNEIFPALFKHRGYTKGEALIAWSLSRLEESISELPEKLRESDDWNV